MLNPHRLFEPLAKQKSSFLLSPRIEKKGAVHLARGSRIPLELPTATSPPKKTYCVVCLGPNCTQMKIRIDEDFSLKQIFKETGAIQLVVFKED